MLRRKSRLVMQSGCTPTQMQALHCCEYSFRSQCLCSTFHSSCSSTALHCGAAMSIEQPWCLSWLACLFMKVFYNPHTACRGPRTTIFEWAACKQGIEVGHSPFFPQTKGEHFDLFLSYVQGFSGGGPAVPCSGWRSRPCPQERV